MFSLLLLTLGKVQEADLSYNVILASEAFYKVGGFSCAFVCVCVCVWFAQSLARCFARLLHYLEYKIRTQYSTSIGGALKRHSQVNVGF